MESTREGHTANTGRADCWQAHLIGLTFLSRRTGGDEGTAPAGEEQPWMQAQARLNEARADGGVGAEERERMEEQERMS